MESKEIYSPQFSEYYDMLYGEKGYVLECNHLENIFNRFGKVTSILDLGCGTGTHAIELGSRGYKVLGIDLSQNLINIANSKKKPEDQNVTFEVGDARSIHSAQVYSAVIAMFGIASYQLTRDDIIRMFKSANRNLAAGGLFIFDFWNHNAVVQATRPNGTMKEIKISKDEKHGMRTIYKYTEVIPDGQESNLATYSATIIILESGKEAVIIKDKHRQRFFSVNEIKEILQDAGFSMVGVDGGNLGTTHIQSEGVNRLHWNISVIARKEMDRGW
jgi:SAM-dependent methyltransferase